MPGKGVNFLVGYVYQLPFDAPQEIEDIKRFGIKANSADGDEMIRQDTVKGVRVWIIKLGEEREARTSWRVILNREDTWVRSPPICSNEGALTVDHRQLVEKLADLVASRLAARPTGPARYSYEGPFSYVKSPCDMYTREDFKVSYQEHDLGRVDEVYITTPIRTTGAGDTAQFGTRFHVETICDGRNENAWTPSGGRYDAKVPPTGMEVTFSYYESEEGAYDANDYACDGNKEYAKPGKKPIKVNGETLVFKVKNVLVEMEAYDGRIFDDEDKIYDTYFFAGKKIEERLKKTLR